MHYECKGKTAEIINIILMQHYFMHQSTKFSHPGEQAPGICFPSLRPSVLQPFVIMNHQSLVDPLHAHRPHAKYIPKQDNINAE